MADRSRRRSGALAAGCGGFGGARALAAHAGEAGLPAFLVLRDCRMEAPLGTGLGGALGGVALVALHLDALERVGPARLARVVALEAAARGEEEDDDGSRGEGDLHGGRHHSAG